MVDELTCILNFRTPNKIIMVIEIVVVTIGHVEKMRFDVNTVGLGVKAGAEGVVSVLSPDETRTGGPQS